MSDGNVLLTVFVGIVALSNLILLSGLAYLAITIKRLIDTSIRPAMTEVNSAVKTVNELVDKVETKAEHVLDIGEETVREVSGKVVATSDMVQHTVASPLIGISSFLTGLSKAISALRSASASQ